MTNKKESMEHFHCRICLLTETQGKRSKGTASIFSFEATIGKSFKIIEIQSFAA